MIPVVLQIEPGIFDARVRKPGMAFLQQCPNPSARQFKSRDYWRRILPNLYSEYNSICAYSCQWISPPPTGFRSVEHFQPKLRYPQTAYEWANYRLVCGALNGCKGEHEDVLDPFLVAPNTFQIKFPSMLVAPNPELGDFQITQVEQTISRLKLNDESVCVQGRMDWASEYCRLESAANEEVAFAFLSRMAPFLAIELERQGLRGQLNAMFSVNEN